MTPEQKEKIWTSESVREARLKLEACYVLADAINSFIMDAEFILNRNKLYLFQQEKRMFSNMLSSIQRARASSQICAKIIYRSERADDACEESDDIRDLMWTILQRIDDSSPEATHQSYARIRAAIIGTMPNLFTSHRLTGI